MLTVGLIYLILIGITYLVLARFDRAKTILSLQVAARSLRMLLPLLIAIFGLVGLFQEFLTPEQVQQVMGSANGLISLLFGGLLGAVAIGPPLAAYPLAGSMLDAGAWAPAVAAFIVSWISVGIVTLPFEASVFSLRFAILRNSVNFALALLIGLLLGIFL